MTPYSALLVKADKENCNNTWSKSRIFKLNLAYFVAYSKKAIQSTNTAKIPGIWYYINLYTHRKLISDQWLEKFSKYDYKGESALFTIPGITHSHY